MNCATTRRKDGRGEGWKDRKRDGRIVKSPAWEGTAAVLYDESRANFH